jgi:hypothetical protein
MPEKIVNKTQQLVGDGAILGVPGPGIFTLAIPVQLAAMTTSAADLITEWTPGFKGKILGIDFVTTKLGTGAAATQTLNLEINDVDVTGGVVNPTLASTDTLGKKTAGSAITALNEFDETDTLSLEVAASGTVFTAGDGVLLIRVQNIQG